VKVTSTEELHLGFSLSSQSVSMIPINGRSIKFHAFSVLIQHPPKKPYMVVALWLGKEIPEK
jgi:hypothetical protein